MVLIAGQGRPASRPTSATSQATSGPTGPRIVDFGDGIKINYIDRQVEVSGEVILREGPLELFAYSKAPAPKEHESIVLVKAKPHRVFMALGLIGATPGKPLRWFPETQTLRIATGDPIEVLVRYREGGKERTAPATAWMLDAEKRKPMPPTHWIFCGSEQAETGEFAANMEGTMVTVVDFTTSLLSLPQQHSDSDSELWLVANEQAIPPLGTPVTLILRPMPTSIHLRMQASGDIVMNEQVIPRRELATIVRNRTAGWIERARIVIESNGDRAVRANDIDALRRELVGVGVEAQHMTIAKPEKDSDGKKKVESAASRPAALNG